MAVFDLDPFVRAVERFANDLGNVGWGFLALALGLSLALQLCRAHAWSNSLRAAYPESGFREREVAAAFLIGAGLNGILPAKGGEAIKIVLAKRSVRGSSYPAIISSFAVLVPFDSGIGLIVLLCHHAGAPARLPEIPDLPAFEISFWVENPEFLFFTLTALGIGLIVLFVFLARRVEGFWAQVRQGVAIFGQRGGTCARCWPGRRPDGSAGSCRSGCSSTPSTSAGRWRTSSW